MPDRYLIFRYRDMSPSRPRIPYPCLRAVEARVPTKKDPTKKDPINMKDRMKKRDQIPYHSV